MKQSGSILRSIPAFFILALVLVSGFVSCESNSKISTSNLSSLYRPAETKLHPDFRLFHAADSFSYLYFRISTDELLYTKKDNDSQFVAKVQLSYRLYESFEVNTLLDSTSTVLIDAGTSEKSRQIIGKIRVNIKSGTKSLLAVTVRDIYRGTSLTKYLSSDKSSPQTAQNYLVRSATSGLPLFHNHLKHGEKVAVSYRDGSSSVLFAKFYTVDIPLAPPPFSMNPPKTVDLFPDSSFVLSKRDSLGFHFEAKQEGIYLFTQEKEKTKGLAMNYFNPEFPEVNSPEYLIPPLRFITSKKEFNELNNSETPKAALDNFWLSTNANRERARDLIKYYYNRVRSSNELFTSYIEGWKSDRGMIYIIFGPPNILYRGTKSETWIYGEENHYMSRTFTFIKVENALSDNDYILNRSPIFKNDWYRAVDLWRQGRVQGS